LIPIQARLPVKSTGQKWSRGREGLGWLIQGPLHLALPGL